MGSLKVKFKDKLAICYTCCGPTYRKSAKDKLLNYYIESSKFILFHFNR